MRPCWLTHRLLPLCLAWDRRRRLASERNPWDGKLSYARIVPIEFARALNLAGQAASRPVHGPFPVPSDAGTVLMHADNRRVDHLRGGVMSPPPPESETPPGGTSGV